MAPRHQALTRCSGDIHCATPHAHSPHPQTRLAVPLNGTAKRLCRVDPAVFEDSSGSRPAQNRAMLPVRPVRLLLLFAALAFVLAGADSLAQALASWPPILWLGHRRCSALITASLIAAYPWLAPALMRALVRQALDQDPNQRQRLSCLLDRVLSAESKAMNSASVRPPTPNSTHVLRVRHTSPIAHGLGLPGSSVIFVSTALSESDLDDTTLTAVLAHERAHITRRHTLWQASFFALLYAAKALSPIPLAPAAALALAVGSVLAYLAFLRRCEFDADATAASTVGPQTMLQGLTALQPLLDPPTQSLNGLAALISSHPPTQARIEALARLALANDLPKP